MSVGLTQAQIAKEAGISERCYQRYEANQKQRMPDIRTAIRIADALGIQDVRSLWGGNPTG